MVKLANPGGLHGEAASFYSEDVPMVVDAASAAVLVGDVVSFTGPGVVKKTVAASNPRLVAGVAKEAGTAGRNLLVTVFGDAAVNVGAGAPAIGDVAGVGGTDGQASVVAAAGVDATIIVGANFGVYTSVKDAANRARVWLARL